MAKLSDTAARKLRAQGKDHIVWCDQTPGFGVRVKPSGAATWIVDYRDGAGKKRRETIGPILLWACEDARAKAIATKDTAKPPSGPSTIRALARRYLAEWAVAPRKKPRSIREDQRLLDLHILPELGDVPVHRLTRGQVASFVAGKMNTPVQANRILALLSKMLSLAELWGMRQGPSPTKGIERFPEKPRERYLDEDEYGRLGKALDELTSGVAGKRSKPRRETLTAIACVRFIALTGCRKSEAQALRWSWIDLERGVAALPDSKSGEKPLYLPEAAIEALRSAPRIAGCDCVFPGRRRRDGEWRPIQDIQNAIERIRAAAGLADITLHTLRHSFGTTAVDENVDMRRVAAIFGHRRIETTKGYMHARRKTVSGAANQVGSVIADRLRRRALSAGEKAAEDKGLASTQEISSGE